ncbi:MAG TPA: hypothetical protein EYQ78_05935, partial [Candidatus Poseidoniales archaeon]|nr:hypothetical protein [Candidatus Poseidoniales archaeon]
MEGPSSSGGEIKHVSFDISGISGLVGYQNELSRRDCFKLSFGPNHDANSPVVTDDGMFWLYEAHSSFYPGAQSYYTMSETGCVYAGTWQENTLNSALSYTMNDALILYSLAWSNVTNVSYTIIDSAIDEEVYQSNPNVASRDGRNYFIAMYGCAELTPGESELCELGIGDVTASSSMSSESFFSMLITQDADNDGWVDSLDELPLEPTQHFDRDSDGYGDDPMGDYADGCPGQFGNSTIDQLGCMDMDGDGWSNAGDAMPSEKTQWLDSDGDGWGDNASGNRADDCPTQFGTSLQRGIRGCSDTDGDGYADIIDAFNTDSTQWDDTDGDGHGDNPSGTEPDKFRGDSTQWLDQDNDGRGDNPVGNNSDAFPNDSSQWNDTDNDGFGDELYGSRGDACKYDFGTSTIDRLGCLDTDGDGY